MTHPILMQILQKRNLSPLELDLFFSENLRALPNFGLLPDIEKASLRIIEAIEKKELIVIFGDYDVDGTTSCALLYHFFQMLSVKVELIQPGRFREGYGIHPPHIERVHEMRGKVLITVDCGITAHPAALKALELGIDLIITDHHQDASGEELKAFAVVNPNRQDCVNHPLKTLAGVGVAFSLAVEVKRLWEKRGGTCPTLYPLLAFVAVGTIADLAHLDYVNLILVRHGLKALALTEYLGLRAFFTDEERRNGKIDADKIAFTIGPMINSKGRLDHPEKALTLLTATDEKVARENYFHLEISNRERKLIQKEVTAEAIQLIDQRPLAPINVVFAPHWHEGVIGIVASKLVEQYKRPAIVFSSSEDQNHLKASCRSAGDLDLFSELKKCEQFFLKFGGHKKAAGLTLHLNQLQKFKDQLIRNMLEYPEEHYLEKERIDLEIEFSQIDLDLVNALESMAPFGQGNPRPQFLIKNLKILEYTFLKDEHVRWMFMSTDDYAQQKIQGISFFFKQKNMAVTAEDFLQQQQKKNLSILANVGINHWAGKKFLQLQVKNLYLT